MTAATITPGLRHRLRKIGLTPAHVSRAMASTGGTAFPGSAPAASAAAADRLIDPDLADITIPDTPEGLAELASDPAAWAKVTANGARFTQFIDAYASMAINKQKSIQVQIEEGVQRQMAAFLRTQEEDGYRPVNLAHGAPRGGGFSVSNSAYGRAGLYNPQALGAPLNSEFRNSSDYFSLIWHQRQHDSASHLRLARVRNAFSTGVPSEGGFLIPEQLRSDLLALSLETSIVRSRAFVVPMESLRVPFPAIDETTHVDSVFGGIVAYWTEEGASLTESSASFGRVVLDAKKLTALAIIPNELMSDSLASFQAFIDQKFPEAIAFYEDKAFLKGSGVGEPHGGLADDNTAMVVVAKESGQAAATLYWENIVKMYSRMLPASLGRAVWIATIDALPEILTMGLTVGTGGSAVFVNNGSEGPPVSILGRPVIFTEKAPGTLGTQGDLSFVDLGYYLIGDRQAMSATSSPHWKFGNDQTAFRIINRVDGMPWLKSAITPENGGPTLSPYVQLATRS